MMVWVTKVLVVLGLGWLLVGFTIGVLLVLPAHWKQLGQTDRRLALLLLSTLMGPYAVGLQ